MDPMLLALIITYFLKNAATDLSFHLRGESSPLDARRAQRQKAVTDWATHRGKRTPKPTGPAREYMRERWADAGVTATARRRARAAARSPLQLQRIDRREARHAAATRERWQRRDTRRADRRTARETARAERKRAFIGSPLDPAAIDAAATATARGDRPETAVGDVTGETGWSVVASPDLDAYAAGKVDPAGIRCALCGHAPCQCPPSGTPEYGELVAERHGLPAPERAATCEALDDGRRCGKSTGGGPYCDACVADLDSMNRDVMQAIALGLAASSPHDVEPGSADTGDWKAALTEASQRRMEERDDALAADPPESRCPECGEWKAADAVDGDVARFTDACGDWFVDLPTAPPEDDRPHTTGGETKGTTSMPAIQVEPAEGGLESVYSFANQYAAALNALFAATEATAGAQNAEKAPGTNSALQILQAGLRDLGTVGLPELRNAVAADIVVRDAYAASGNTASSREHVTS